MRSTIPLLLLFLQALPSFAVDKVIQYTLETDCPGQDWGSTDNLYSDLRIIIGTNRTNNRIEGVDPGTYKFKQGVIGDFYSKDDSESQAKFLRRTDLDWSFVFAITFRDNIGYEVGNDYIYYGYNPKYMHVNPPRNVKDTKGNFGDSSKPFYVHPFRFSKIYLKDDTGREHLNLKADCNSVNPRAWIAQPGIYRLIVPKNSRNDFYFENIYYWPRPGMILT